MFARTFDADVREWSREPGPQTVHIWHVARHLYTTLNLIVGTTLAGEKVHFEF